MIKLFDYLKIIAKKLARNKKKNVEKIEDFKTKLDVFLASDRITLEEYKEILDILEPTEKEETEAEETKEV